MKYIINHFSRFKYIYALIAFGVWMVFFDQNRLINHYKLNKTLKGLEQKQQYYEEEILKNQKMSKALMSDTVFLEKFAREKYLFKRDNEVIYMIVKEDTNQ